MEKISILLCAGLFACSEYELKEQEEAEVGVYPTIEVTPSALSFMQADVGSPEEDLFTISNVGSTNLNVSDLQLMGSSTFSFTQLSNPILGPGTSQDVYVIYAPTTEGVDDTGSIMISSNDPDNPMVEVPLNGFAEIPGTPSLEIDPIVMDLGNNSVGSAATGVFTLSSVGDVPVTVNSFDLTGTPTPFTASYGEAWPLVLSPGESTTVNVSFIPTSSGSFSELFSVDCDDPAIDPTASVIASAGDTLPIADCYVDPASVQPNTGSTATWYGNGSYDDSGAAITSYNWTLVSKPAGSQAYMPSGTANRTGFAPDLAGDYVGQLVVTNEYGVTSEPCETTLVAVPGQNLWVQMSWTTPGDDMDLHMTINNGAYESTDDCYYGNCTWITPDWGVIGSATDDPSLDQDDILGTGPENITMQNPSSATYTVVVHDYPSSVVTGGNDVTVVIFLGGVQVWSDTRTISGEGTYTPFAEINYPAATVTPL
jgi:hypothetical protein